MDFSRIFTHELFPARESTYIRWYPKSLIPTKDYIPNFRDAKVSGFYVHVPFCDKVCRFCPFNKRQSHLELMADFVEAICKEIEEYSKLGVGGNIEFVYFGGGTPTALSDKQLARILSSLQRFFQISDRCEISIEAHPTHITTQRCATLRSIGFNRLSTGIQSFCDDSLISMGAHHTSADSRNAIDNACLEFENVAIDLLYRLPGQTLDHWREQLETALSFEGVTHFSCYSLILKDISKLPNRVLDVQMCVEAMNSLADAGFEHYASCASGGFDACRPGRECVYGLKHWRAPQASYIPLGPGAIGYVDEHMLINGMGVGEYSKHLLDHGKLYLASSHPVSEEEAMRKFFVIGVKTLSIQFDGFRERFGKDPATVFEQEFKYLESAGLAEISGDVLSLTPVGRLLVDNVSEVFFSAAELSVAHPEEPEIRRAELASNRVSPPRV